MRSRVGIATTLAEQTVLSEVFALRMILINLICDLAAGHEIVNNTFDYLFMMFRQQCTETWDPKTNTLNCGK